ncbi:hypothetical protein CPB86DRAFT_551388 [Serendipita vermifera]|nr:hypothetical protein CPB86DRAFT_551388 [Serendipita vermifera]
MNHNIKGENGGAKTDGAAGPPKLSNQFPPDYGDFGIESDDGVQFHVPRTLLIQASPIFRDMFAFGTNDEKGFVKLTEDHKTLEQLLCHIDPAKTNPTFEWKYIARLLAAADKYDIKNIAEWFRSSVALEAFQSNGNVQEPVLCLALADRYKLDEIARKALRHLIRYPILELTENDEIGRHFFRHLMMLRADRISTLTKELLNLERKYGAIFVCGYHSTPFLNWARPALELLPVKPSKETILGAKRKKTRGCTCKPFDYPAAWLDKLQEIEDELPPLPKNTFSQ